MMPSNDYGFLITVMNKITKPQNTAIARPFRTKSLIDDFSSASELIALSSVKSELFVGSSSFCVSSTSIGSMVSFWLSAMLSASSI